MGGIERGTVGWSSGEHYDIGTEENGGQTLVCVQLLRGKNPVEPLTPGRGQGQMLLCQLPDGLSRIPPVGTPVLVAIPNGMETVQGAAVIIATLGSTPSNQFAEDRAKMDFGPDTHLMIRAKSITLSDFHEPGRFIMIGESPAGGDAGIIMQDEEGSGMMVVGGKVTVFSAQNGEAKSWLTVTPTSLESIQVDTGTVMLKDGDITIVASGSAHIDGGVILLGTFPAAPIVGVPAAVLATAFPFTPTSIAPSKKVFIQPM